MANIVIYTIFIILMITAAACDVLMLKIPNAVSMSIGVLAAIEIYLWRLPLMDHIIAAIVTLIILLVCALQGKLGGGDVKLTSAVVLFLGSGPILQSFLFASAIAGAATALVAVGMRLVPLPKVAMAFEWFRRVATGLRDGRASLNDPVPYAVPICIGAVLALWFDGVTR